MFRNWLVHPKTKNLDIDDPKTTLIRRKIIQEKKFLRKIYNGWYQLIKKSIPDDVEGGVLEIGSGAGFIKEVLPETMTSEVFECEGVDRVIDATSFPFEDGSLRAIIMTDVFHHIPNVRSFLNEAERVLAVGGRVIMIEPWNCAWSRFIYQNLHHEPFVPEAPEWEFPTNGPLSSANGALPWMVFSRDLEKFQLQFPHLTLEGTQIFMPFTYLLSGGVSLRSLIPGALYGFFSILEIPFEKLGVGMFAKIELKKI